MNKNPDEKERTREIKGERERNCSVNHLKWKRLHNSTSSRDNEEKKKEKGKE